MSTVLTDDLEINGELIIRSGKSKGIAIYPSGTNEYAPIKWYDQEGNYVAGLVAHENNSSGDIHNHLSIYLCNVDRRQRESRIDFQFGVEHPIVSFENCRVRLKGGNSWIELRDEAGKYWKLSVDTNGNLGTEKV